MNKRQIGTFYEREAVRYSQEQKVQILELNYRCRQGEIDIIGYDDSCLVFFEVKARRSLKNGYGTEAVNYHKQHNICRVADYYRMKHGIGEFTNIRYDCISIDEGKLCWIKNAFEHIF